jgi:hypothetical protein
LTATLLSFPEANVQDIPKQLRTIADQIENGEFGDAHNLAWVIDQGNGSVEMGLLGSYARAGAEFILLLELAKQRFLNAI